MLIRAGRTNRRTLSFDPAGGELAGPGPVPPGAASVRPGIATTQPGPGKQPPLHPTLAPGVAAAVHDTDQSPDTQELPPPPVLTRLGCWSCNRLRCSQRGSSQIHACRRFTVPVRFVTAAGGGVETSTGNPPKKKISMHGFDLSKIAGQSGTLLVHVWHFLAITFIFKNLLSESCFKTAQQIQTVVLL